MVIQAIDNVCTSTPETVADCERLISEKSLANAISVLNYFYELKRGLMTESLRSGASSATRRELSPVSSYNVCACCYQI